jgi:uncharacterized protein (DUF3084 family)
MSFGARYSGIMETMREAWTDRRLDGLSHEVGEFEQRVDARFEQVDARFEQVDARFDHFEQRVDERFTQVDDRLDRFETTMDRRFGRLEDRFDAYQRSNLQMTAVIIAALIGFIATQV